MQRDNPTPQWYALTVKPRHEGAAARNLRLKELESFAPVYRARRQWCDRLKELELQLFPGYVFCRFGYAQRLAVLNTPGVTSVVGFGQAPAAIPDEEIASVRRLVSSRLPLECWPYVRVGQKVRIRTGCLEGVTGTIVRDKDAWRVIVSVELLQRSVAVEIDRELISPAGPATPRLVYPAPALSAEGLLCPS